MRKTKEFKERWRPIKSFEGLYEVSNFGRVRSLSRWVDCRNGERLLDGRLLKQKIGNNGYYGVTLCNGTIQTDADTHRIIAYAFLPGKSLDVVRHLDGNPLNNSLKNLAWGSFEDNEADKKKHGRTPLGENHHRAVLNNSLVLIIKDMHRRGFSQLKIAEIIGFNRGVVGNVVRGETWNHVS